MPAKVLSSVSTYTDRYTDSDPSSSPRRGDPPPTPKVPSGLLMATKFVPVWIEEEPRIEEVKLTSGPYSGADALAVTIHLACEDDQLLWAVFNDSKELLISLLTEQARRVFGKQFQIAEVHFKRGSLILTIYVTVKAWVLLHKGLFATIAFLTGIYLPLKELVKDISGWMPRLKQLILGFFHQEPPPLIEDGV
jgi:hypothetical protein